MRRIICLTACLAVLGLVAPVGWGMDRLVPSQYATIQAAMAQAVPGDRIVISGTQTENGAVTVGINNLTFTSGSPRADIRESRWQVFGQNITFDNVDINGNSAAGAQSTTATDLVVLYPSADNITFTGCKIVNPAPGQGTGENANTVEAEHSAPGTCIDVRSAGALTIRNCNFVNQDFTTALQNIVGLHFNQSIASGPGPILVENCVFRCERRCIDFQTSFSNITIRNCSMQGDPGATGAAAGIYLHLDDILPVSVVNNVLVENCNFLGNGNAGQYWVSIFPMAGEIHNMTIRGCNFPASSGGDDIYWRMRGDGLLVEQCTFDGGIGIVNRMTVRVDTGNVSGIGAGDARLVFRDCVIRDNVYTNLAGSCISCGEGFLSGFILENNYFADMPASYAFGALDLPFSGYIRKNEMLRCGATGILGGISTVLNDGVITDNFILDCRVGIALRTSRGEYWDGVNPQVERNTRNVTLARNIVIRSASDAFFDSSTDAGLQLSTTWTGRPVNIRYINNTVVNAGNDCIALRGNNLSAYNNILFGGIGAVRDLSPAGNPSTFAAIGFNITYNNSYFGITFPGGGPRPRTDIRLTIPVLFAGGPFPTTRAAATPFPGSAAIDAGSSNGVDPDYVTDIGAIEVGAVTDTGVPGSAWELYR